jgi:hypothetical protein
MTLRHNSDHGKLILTDGERGDGDHSHRNSGDKHVAIRSAVADASPRVLPDDVTSPQATGHRGSFRALHDVMYRFFRFVSSRTSFSGTATAKRSAAIVPDDQASRCATAKSIKRHSSTASFFFGRSALTLEL